MKIKLIVLALIIALQAFVFNYAHASGNHVTVNNYYPTEVIEIPSILQSNGISGSYIDELMAMSAAADYCVFDYAKGWQGCVSTGFFGGAVAYNLQFATRVDCWMVSFGVQADDDFGDFAGGVGGSWHFGC